MVRLSRQIGIARLSCNGTAFECYNYKLPRYVGSLYLIPVFHCLCKFLLAVTSGVVCGV